MSNKPFKITFMVSVLVSLTSTALMAADDAELSPIPLPEQTGPGARPEPSARSSNRLIEEVIVTAQKRAQAIQDVPISIAAFSADQLDAQGVTTADGLARVTPGMTFTKTGGFTVIYLRGIGTDAFLPGADQTVPQYIDGVNVIGAQGSQYELGRVARLEILKGPQGTLFGRNSTGGAINIITPDPSNVFEGDVETEFSESQTWNSKAYANIPVTDTLAFTISGFNNTHDEYYENASGDILKDAYQRGAATKIRWSALDDLTFTLYGQLVSSQVSDSLVLENTDPTPILGALIPADKLDRVAHNDVLGGSNYRTHLISAVANWSTSWFDTKLILSDQRYSSSFNQLDFDSSALPLVSFVVPKQFAKQRTAELQFLSNEDTPFGDKFEWVGGFYYLEGLGGFSELDLHVAKSVQDTLLGPINRTVGSIFNSQLLAAGLPSLMIGDITATAGGLIDSKSISAYLQGTYYFTDALNLTMGLRYQKEERGIRKSRLGILNPLNGDEYALLNFNAPDLTAKQLAPRVALQWKISEDTQIYTSWARGFQSPTYNAVNFFTTPDPVEEVQVDAYEIGAKSILLDNNLQIDVAAFYTDEKNVTNAFVSLTSGGVVRFDNVGAAEIYGAEFSGTLTPMPNVNPGLAVSGGATYLHTEYTDFKNGRGFDELTGLAFGPGLVTPLPPRDFTGNRIVRTPEWTYTIALNQAIPVGSGSLELGVDYYYNAGFFYLAQNSDRYAQDAYAYLNARVSYLYDPWNVRVTAYCLNLTDEQYSDSVFPTDFGRAEHLSLPRLFGVKTSWNF